MPRLLLIFLFANIASIQPAQLFSQQRAKTEILQSTTRSIHLRMQTSLPDSLPTLLAKKSS
ncbi:MAG: hypothetical protein ACE5I1_12905, partial [bacterium]